MRPLTPSPMLDFVDGPLVDDTAALTAWLAAHDDDARQLKLPVSMDNVVIGLANFAVGTISIRVSDSALGVSLADHVRTKCKGLARCRLWLEGYWSAQTLSLRRVGERVDDDGEIRVAIEADAGESRD